MHASFLTTATQIQLANYITNTGCEWGFQWAPGQWSKPHLGEPLDLFSRFLVRIALTDLNLPSHLPPHNPANIPAEVITQGGYRAWSVMEHEISSIRTSDPMLVECWIDSKWNDTGWKGSLEYKCYRVSVSVPFPDWEEMSKAKPEPEGAVIDEATPQHTFAMPQPVTDPMPPLAEGCKRYYTRWDEAWECIGDSQFDNDTHFFDLRNLSLPEDVNFIAFEKAWQDCTIPHGNKEEAWKLWNAALESLNA